MQKIKSLGKLGPSHKVIQIAGDERASEEMHSLAGLQGRGQRGGCSLMAQDLARLCTVSPSSLLVGEAGSQVTPRLHSTFQSSFWLRVPLGSGPLQWQSLLQSEGNQQEG